MDTFVLTYDLGTTGCKTCLYRIGKTLDLLGAALAEYPLHVTDDGGVEQKADDWWQAVCTTSREVLAKASLAPDAIKGLAFCCQMQGSILVDRQGNALRNPMIYMDGRATRQMEDHLCHGLLRISGMNLIKALNALRITGGVAATPKDPLWKYHWVRENEPAIFKKVHKWLDVKDYLILRCTGKIGMTRDSAHVTFIYDTRPGKEKWHPGLCHTFGVNMDHLPKVVHATDVVGTLSANAASETGLSPGIPVFGGGGDVTMAAIGSGCLDLFDTHIYVGTSGWVAANVNKRWVDIENFMASILGAVPGRYNYVGEQETSGACLKWVRDHLALDEIGIYLQGKKDPEEQMEDLYKLLNQVVAETEPGAGNLIFTPWLHGNRAPREDANARGIFFNIGMNTGKRQMIRAVLEGVSYHKRWILEAMEKKIPFQKSICFVGGGAKSDVWCQIMADVTGRKIRTVKYPQDIGTVGAAIVCGVGLKILPTFKGAKELIPMGSSFHPQPEYRAVYDRNFDVFKSLYQKNKTLFRTLNKR
ncbi:MAG: FGGY-family carbohydrate kinase [Proteobacteria bacterium]|nr:FGGY-family carbohydrate kinase [Pseudomonadota bacterium]